jgi:hypothetical protein
LLLNFTRLGFQPLIFGSSLNRSLKKLCYYRLFTAIQGSSNRSDSLTQIPDRSRIRPFTGYHAVWYNAWKSDSCKAGWHTHVDSGIIVANASNAIKLQLEVLIKWLNEN